MLLLARRKGGGGATNAIGSPPTALQTRAHSDEFTPEGAGGKSRHMFVRGGEERVVVDVSFKKSECARTRVGALHR